jgi:hypothetical protein
MTSLGRFVAPEAGGATGFNPGFQPWGTARPGDALKGRQIRRTRNRREEPIYLGPQSLHFELLRLIVANGKTVSPPNKLFSVAIGRVWPT